MVVAATMMLSARRQACRFRGVGVMGMDLRVAWLLLGLRSEGCAAWSAVVVAGACCCLACLGVVEGAGRKRKERCVAFESWRNSFERIGREGSGCLVSLAGFEK